MLGTTFPEQVNFKSSLTKIVRKDFAQESKPDIESSQVFFCRPRPHKLMQDGRGTQLAHGHPGTPVSDLFPLGNAILGNGNRSSLRPTRARELRSHSAGYEPNAPYGLRGVRENRGRSPRVGEGEFLGQSIRMVGQFLPTKSKWPQELPLSSRSKLHQQLGGKTPE